MQSEGDRGSKAEDGERRFDGRVFLSHYAHVQNGRRTLKRCGFCTGGLDEVAPRSKTAAVVEVDPVVPDSGGDKEGATAPARPGQWDWGT